jgi:phage terminase large subunit-like protein
MIFTPLFGMSSVVRRCLEEKGNPELKESRSKAAAL